MRSKIFIAALTLFTFVSGTDVSGIISSNTTWTLANSPYTITGTVVISSGVTLTIEAGVIININADESIFVNGTLIAQGTSSSKITFTSSQSSKAAGDWGLIKFFDSLSRLGIAIPPQNISPPCWLNSLEIDFKTSFTDGPG